MLSCAGSQDLPSGQEEGAWFSPAEDSEIKDSCRRATNGVCRRATFIRFVSLLFLRSHRVEVGWIDSRGVSTFRKPVGVALFAFAAPPFYRFWWVVYRLAHAYDPGCARSGGRTCTWVGVHITRRFKICTSSFNAASAFSLMRFACVLRTCTVSFSVLVLGECRPR